MTLRKLPKTVYLPTSTVLKPAEVRKACGGASRATLLYWRRYHHGPKVWGSNNGSHYIAQEVSAWLIKQGCIVKWI